MIDRTFSGNISYENVDGFETLDSIDDDDGYGFHTLLVIRDTKNGRVYYGEDSGCSCPQPFEDHTTLSSFTAVTQRSFIEFVKTVEGYGVKREEKDKMIGAVALALAAMKST